MQAQSRPILLHSTTKFADTAAISAHETLPLSLSPSVPLVSNPLVCAQTIRLNSPTTVYAHREGLINPFIKAAAEDHTDADCLIVVAMSHGESGLLHSIDSLYPVDMLWTPFTGDRCSSLAGKPKLFFIQVRYLTGAPYIHRGG